MSSQIGSLSARSYADVALFRLEPFTDVHQYALKGSQLLVPQLTLKSSVPQWRVLPV